MNEDLAGVEKQIELPVDVFRILRDILYEQSGVYLNDNSKFFLENRLQNSVNRPLFVNLTSNLNDFDPMVDTVPPGCAAATRFLKTN